MLQISQLRMVLDHDEEALKAAAARELRVPLHFIRSLAIKQRAIDARRGNVEFSYTVLVSVLEEEGVLRRMVKNSRVSLAPEESYTQLEGMPGVPPANFRPVLVGTGPCGLFAGLLLARQGMNPILLERGKAAGDRARDVTGFWRRGWDFNPDSNVQFGEGGAGTFSDGKLYTQIRDREHRIPWVLRELVKAGAPEDILVNNRPHIGTDRLIKVVRHIREEIIALGGEVRFESRVADVKIEDSVMKAVTLASGEVIESNQFVFAIGHSSRDTFEMLHRHGVPFEAKPFSVGVRIEHPQKVIDQSQYGRFSGHSKLGAAAYRFVVHCSTGRSAYSFCMCPGGLVVGSASEAGMVVTNGMSSYAREESNANSGFMVEVTEADFGGTGALAGIEFQRNLERKAFEVGGGDYKAPAQLLGDFMAGRPSTGPGSVTPSYLPGVTWTDLRLCLPDYVVATLQEAIKGLDKQIPGFAMDDAVMIGVETRSSSPVRIPRDPASSECVGIRGFYPAGEGAGYAGGIISAAVDGMRVAEQLMRPNG
ncbi:MAG: dependent oxidoreductase [Verrucomicrobiaceae bacterium]|nr:dependent oxidoreductase [Verrucomicrobiaceae bacterium]